MSFLAVKKKACGWLLATGESKSPNIARCERILDGWRLFAKAKRTSASLSLASRLRLLPRLRTTFVFAKANTNIVRTHHPTERKKNRPSIDGLLSLAGMDGFEPSKCQSQSLVPYRLATSQYCFSILSYFILVVKHFIKKFIFYKKMRKHHLKYDTKTCFLFGNNL